MIARVRIAVRHAQDALGQYAEALRCAGEGEKLMQAGSLPAVATAGAPLRRPKAMRGEPEPRDGKNAARRWLGD
jgi:hypothetical protein